MRDRSTATAATTAEPPAAVADVTVVVPALDREDRVGAAVRSATSQVPPPARVLVVDDGSEDATAARARAAGAEVLSAGPRGGSGPARNVGIASATTTWVAFLDSDDEWQPGHLAGLLARAGDHAMVTAPALSSHGRWKGNSTGRPARLNQRGLLDPVSTVITSGTMVRRDVLDAVGGFRDLRRAQDLDLWLRVLEQGSGLALDVATVTYTEHAGQVSVDRALMRAHFDDVLRLHADAAWMSEQLRRRSLVRWHWDDARSAVAARRPAKALRAGGLLLRRPAQLTTLLRLLRQRRRERLISSPPGG
ncbi:glycosyltransferase family 2 protein [Pseudokineococcus lusitanus]|uniref:Glycosyltransferase involved in cell wall biosynthesis n=1 Tax=Pseudokineococcus lusitanus TaxID=763993 RepID=A0A3N1G963_9ACTN|nr:glycosyltransferase family A protein [Pseudokineococcus lusitanus]ROP26751.1 glycosyltransferase involved in cell wall biosynthesis [Pseudokineococcus lusitanus]